MPHFWVLGIFFGFNPPWGFSRVPCICIGTPKYSVLRLNWDWPLAKGVFSLVANYVKSNGGEREGGRAGGCAEGNKNSKDKKERKALFCLVLGEIRP